MEKIKKKVLLELFYKTTLRKSEIIDLKANNLKENEIVIISPISQKVTAANISESIREDLNELIKNKNEEDYIFTSKFNNKKLTLRYFERLINETEYLYRGVVKPTRRKPPELIRSELKKDYDCGKKIMLSEKEINELKTILENYRNEKVQLLEVNQGIVDNILNKIQSN